MNNTAIRTCCTAFLLSLFLLPKLVVAQADVRFFKQKVAALCSPTYTGRGYVHKGSEKAAKYIQQQFVSYGLKPVNGRYYQDYTFGVNTFPDTLSLKLNRKILVPGQDYLVDAASGTFHGNRVKVKTVNLDKVKEEKDWEEMKTTFSKGKNAWLLKNADSLYKRIKLNKHRMSKALPEGIYLLPQHGKMIWTVSAAPPEKAMVFYVEDSVLPRRVRRLTAHVHNKYLSDHKAQNVMAMVPGTAVPDSFLVFTAHYDHLGRMGYEAVFPGASDNASGTAMMLYLSQYFAKHPQRYSMLFVAFSGEEAGLLGSTHFADHPEVPLEKIRFLINTDIMGDATDGISVVNGTEHKMEFALLDSINNKKKLLPLVYCGGKAANSDHHPFSEKGVTAFFLFSRGGKGYYHDIYDKPATLSYKNIPKVAELIIRFMERMN